MTEKEKGSTKITTTTTDELDASAKGGKNSRGGGVLDLSNPSDNTFDLVSFFINFLIKYFMM